MYGAETWTLRAVKKKHLENFEMWCWRRMEKIIWIDHVRNEEVLLQVNEQRNILHTIRKRKANWIGHILCRNCLLKQVIEGEIKGEMEVTRRQGRRRKKLLDDLKDRGEYSHLKMEALDRNMRRDRFGRGFEPAVRQTTGWWWWCNSNIKHQFRDGKAGRRWLEGFILCHKVSRAGLALKKRNVWNMHWLWKEIIAQDHVNLHFIIPEFNKQLYT